MPAQNIYDDPEFLAGYATLDRQVRGLDGAAEWPVLQQMIPDLRDLRVVDLGCGFGWFTRWAAENHAATVLGIDVSARMLERAVAATTSSTVSYRRMDVDDLDLAAESCDVVFSSLALHYIHNLERLLRTVARALSPGGSLVFSVEHPIYSAPSTQRFEIGDAGNRIWPLDNYLVEGERVTSWFVDGVVRQHRTVATYVNTVIDAGLTIDRLIEFGSAQDSVAKNSVAEGSVMEMSERADDLHRPWFLLLRATKPSQQRSSLR